MGRAITTAELWDERLRAVPTELRLSAYAAAALGEDIRGVVLNATYGYAGSERDLRGTNIIPAGFLSPQAIRMKLLACLSAGLDVEETRWAFSQDDG